MQMQEVGGRPHQESMASPLPGWTSPLHTLSLVLEGVWPLSGAGGDGWQLCSNLPFGLLMVGLERAQLNRNSRGQIAAEQEVTANQPA